MAVGLKIKSKLRFLLVCVCVLIWSTSIKVLVCFTSFLIKDSERRSYMDRAGVYTCTACGSLTEVAVAESECPGASAGPELPGFLIACC